MAATTASLHAIDRILDAMTDADGERLRKASHGHTGSKMRVTTIRTPITTGGNHANP